MTMPDMAGDTFAKDLIGIRPDIPVIICTGFSERVNAEIILDRINRIFKISKIQKAVSN